MTCMLGKSVIDSIYGNGIREVLGKGLMIMLRLIKSIKS